MPLDTRLLGSVNTTLQKRAIRAYFMWSITIRMLEQPEIERRGLNSLRSGTGERFHHVAAQSEEHKLRYSLIA